MKISGKRLFYRLFFTSDEGAEVDLGWLLLLVGFLNAVVMFDLYAFGVVSIGLAAWSFYGSLMLLTFVNGATLAKARLLADSRAVANVASGFHMPNVETSTDLQELSGKG